MHTEKQITDIVRGIDAVMALGTNGFSGYAQAALEVDAIAVYLASQIATLKDEVDREQAIGDVLSHLRIAVDARLASHNPAETLVSTGAAEILHNT